VAFVGGLGECVQRHSILQTEPAAGQPNQTGEMSAATENLAEIVGQRTHVGARRAGHLQRAFRRLPFGQLQAGDFHPAWLAFDLDALAGQLVQ
jgi:hypothetical protein